MEEKINIAEILKDKPKGTKLYSPIFGNLRYEDLVPDLGEFTVVTSDNTSAKHSFWSDSRYNRHGEPLMLLPSKEMRDWSKFAWKKGDVLVSNDGKVKVLFEKFRSDTYLSFIGKHHLDSIDETLHYQNEGEYPTFNFSLESENAVQTYINTIEERLGGKLNRETLEIEKVQPEFKDGDILYAESNAYHYPSIHILNTNCDTRRYYARLVINGRYDEAIDYDIPAFDDDDPNRLRFATEEERQQLFDALAKEGKAWDAEKKQIVDLPKKCELNPFDRVLVRDNSKQKWIPDMYRFYDKDEEFPYNCFSSTYKRCIPYNEDTKHLLGTTDEWKGGEG